nr:NUDIX hydrolase [Brooklawnia cerclae]
MLAVDPKRGVLLQHRVGWSHFGGTWGVPGGARHEGESAVDAALREAREEAGVARHVVRPRLLSLLDLDWWSYTTLVADVQVPFDPVVGDPESVELAWVPVADVETYPLHPGFGESWVRLRGLLVERPVVVVDAANVVGATPDGWWRDRAAAAARLIERITALAAHGIVASELGLPEDRWFPEIVVVVEGEARAVRDPDDPAGGVRIVRASGLGDDAIVAETERLVRAGDAVTVVTSDRGLVRRVGEVGAESHRVRWLLDLLDLLGT